MEDGSGGEHRAGSKSSGDNNVVVQRWLISCDKNRAGLAQMDVKGGVRVLDSVKAFNFDQCHGMSLESYVYRSCQAHIRYSESVCFTLFNCKSVPIHSLAIDEQSIGKRKIPPAV